MLPTLVTVWPLGKRFTPLRKIFQPAQNLVTFPQAPVLHLKSYVSVPDISLPSGGQFGKKHISVSDGLSLEEHKVWFGSLQRTGRDTLPDPQVTEHCSKKQKVWTFDDRWRHRNRCAQMAHSTVTNFLQETYSVIHTFEMKDQNASKIVSGWILETRNETNMRVETVLTLTTKIHRNEHIGYTRWLLSMFGWFNIFFWFQLFKVLENHNDLACDQKTELFFRSAIARANFCPF